MAVSLCCDAWGLAVDPGAPASPFYRETAIFASGSEVGPITASRFELVINLRTAKTLGLSIRFPLLIRADETIDSMTIRQWLCGCSSLSKNWHPAIFNLYSGRGSNAARVLSCNGLGVETRGT